MSRQIEVHEIVRRVFQIYVEEASVLMPAAAVVFVITGIITELLVATGSGGLSLLALVLGLVATTLFTGMVVELVADIQDGRRDSSVGKLLRGVTPVLGRLIVVGLVTGFLEVIGFIFLVIPCLVMMTIWAVAAPVVVVERTGPGRALGRSRELVRGNGWQVFGVIVVLVIGVIVASIVLEVIGAAGGTAVSTVVRVVVGILAAPVPSLAAAVLYFQLHRQDRSGAQQEELFG